MVKHERNRSATLGTSVGNPAPGLGPSLLSGQDHHHSVCGLASAFRRDVLEPTNSVSLQRVRTLQRSSVLEPGPQGRFARGVEAPFPSDDEQRHFRALIGGDRDPVAPSWHQGAFTLGPATDALPKDIALVRHYLLASSLFSRSATLLSARRSLGVAAIQRSRTARSSSCCPSLRCTTAACSV